MEGTLFDVTLVIITIFLVLINGFFVAAEFALVKLRPSQVDTFVAQKRSFARLVRSQLDRLDEALSACQLGITLSWGVVNFSNMDSQLHWIRTKIFATKLTFKSVCS